MLNRRYMQICEDEASNKSRESSPAPIIRSMLRLIYYALHYILIRLQKFCYRLFVRRARLTLLQVSFFHHRPAKAILCSSGHENVLFWENVKESWLLRQFFTSFFLAYMLVSSPRNDFTPFIFCRFLFSSLRLPRMYSMSLELKKDLMDGKSVSFLFIHSISFTSIPGKCCFTIFS